VTDICNPLDLPYAYQDQRGYSRRRTVNRESADPSVVPFKGRYYLFPSMTSGFWHSEDLVDWTLKLTDKIPAYDYAPDVREVDGVLYISGSRLTKISPFFRSEDPMADDFVEHTPGTIPLFDPNLFQDDDGRTYLYWGCRTDQPIWGMELDRTALTPITAKVGLVDSDIHTRGWERIGENHDQKTAGFWLKALGRGRPYVEGAWMTKNDDTYYLQYAAPATESNTYADGYFTARSPLGPFEYSAHSPFSSKPGGFITGAGHGSTFQDAVGNWWHIASMRISVNQQFERRLGLFPAGFDDDGVLFCNQNFADYPMVMPTSKVDPWADTFAGQMLLSYRKPVTASSSLPKHGPELAVNEDIRTWWVPGTAAVGESITVDLEDVLSVQSIQVNIADHDVKKFKPEPPKAERTFQLGGSRAIDPAPHPTEWLLEVSTDGTTWTTVQDNRGTGIDAPHKFVTLEAGSLARFVRLTGGAMPYGGYFAVSGLRVFGIGNGTAPAAVSPTATRLEGRDAAISWAPVDGAQGYNVRYGIHPEKLYSSWMVYGDAELNLSSLNAGHAYWVAVDSFNENGITVGGVIEVPA
jgi:xylan 1,4-beta-xylosidase